MGENNDLGRILSNDIFDPMLLNDAMTIGADEGDGSGGVIQRAPQRRTLLTDADGDVIGLMDEDGSLIPH